MILENKKVAIIFNYAIEIAVKIKFPSVNKTNLSRIKSKNHNLFLIQKTLLG